MFCDIVGSTALAERLDPEDLHEVLKEYQQMCADVIHGFEGYLAQRVGDGLLVYFGYPIAHEDDAQRAVRAGLGILAVLPDLNARVTRIVGATQVSPLHVRIGIHTGLVVVAEMAGGDQREQLALGETPNIAARLQGIAQPDTVVISAATSRLIEGLFTCQQLGRRTLAGISVPVEVLRVLSESGVQSRFEAATRKGLTPLVGREEEVGLLLKRWKQAKEGQGQVVLLSGEAGIGKSRLVQTLTERIGSEAHVRLRYQCSPYRTNSALYPITVQLEGAAGLAREDPPRTKLKKLRALLAPAVTNVDEVLPMFAALMSIPHEARHSRFEMSPQRRKEKTLGALVAQMRGLCKYKPILVVFEDAHWIDPTSLELLDLVVQQITNLRVLLILTFRPEFSPAWDDQPHVASLQLNRLSFEEGKSLVRHVTGPKTLPDEVVDQVVEKTDGVPLFVEEFTKSMLESGLLHEESDRYVLKGPFPSHGIPMTLQDSLMARLDQTAPVKTVAQVGSAIGREFSYELLATVSKLEESEVRDGLEQLIDSGLVFRHGTTLREFYRFKHALVRDAAYDTLLRRKRRQLHADLAAAMEEQFPETAETNPELIAHHCTEAGHTDKAVSYWLKAGRRASDRSANAEAVGHLRRGLQELEKLPDTPQRKRHELELLITLGPPLITTKGPGTGDVERVYTRALELCAQLPESEDHFSAHWGWWRVSMNHQSGLERADKLLTLAHKLGDTSFLLQAHHCHWATLFMLGDQGACCRHIEEGLKLYDPKKHRSDASIYGGHDARVCALGEHALALWLLGYPDRALESVSRAVSWASELSHAASLAHAKDYELMLYRYRREASTVHAKAEEMIEFSRDQGLPDYLAKSIIFRGWATATMGDVEQGLQDMRDGISALQDIGTKEDFPVFFDMLAAGCLMAEHGEEGLAQVDQALADAEQIGMLFWTAELYRRKADLLLSLSDNNESRAEPCLMHALEIAREQHTRSLELRAALSLARLMARRGRTDEAQNLVNPVYSSFTEGFDTIDLKEARTFLEGSV